MAILVLVLLHFLILFLQRFLDLLNFLGQLRKVLVHKIHFLTAFLSGAEFGLFLSIFFKPTTIMSVVCGVRASMLLAKVRMLLEADFLENLCCRLGTRLFIPFLALVRSFLRRFQFGLLVDADALDGLK
jgi:hypothetical protein